MIPVCQPTVEADDLKAVRAVLGSCWLSHGPVVERFEAELQAETGYPYVVALNSCTSALFLALKALELLPGSPVLVPALTFTATAAAVRHAGYAVRFGDVIGPCWLLRPPVGWRPAAIVVVDLYGRLYPRAEIAGWEALGIPVIEDAAHAIGANLVDGATTVCLSFYATKNITTAGEGGALLTRDERIYEFARRHRMHGLSEGAWARYRGGGSYGVEVVGYKLNMTDVQAAMGLSQLQKLRRFCACRRELAYRYDEKLQAWERPGRCMDGVEHLYPVLLPAGVTRNVVMERMKRRQVGTGIHFRSLTREPAWADGQSCPKAEDIGERVLSLPLYPHLTETEQDLVIEAFTQAIVGEQKCAA